MAISTEPTEPQVGISSRRLSSIALSTAARYQRKPQIRDHRVHLMDGDARPFGQEPLFFRGRPVCLYVRRRAYGVQLSPHVCIHLRVRPVCLCIGPITKGTHLTTSFLQHLLDQESVLE
jgi:hypothetical protein